jgi:glycine/D-amino acid oxidase-like deaminating enzyme
MKHFILAAVFSVAAALPAPAQKLVDPATVAPEFREAAEKRRAEQIKQRDCARKADVEKIMPRERTAFLNHCLESAEAK